MKKLDRKGFTLIELLAVIVILAIIMVIAVPKILDVINKSKEEAFIDSAYGISDSAKYYYLENNITGDYNFEFENGKLKNNEELKYKGTSPDSGNLVINSDGKIKLAFYSDSLNLCVKKEFNDKNIKKVAGVTKDKCNTTISSEASTWFWVNIDDENLFYLTHAFVTMMNDISYFECKKRNGIWAFSRSELLKLFELEAKLVSDIGEHPMERPLKGVLMTTISNFILKSRYDYNSDFVAKYISSEVALKSISNHEIWIRETTLLNDSREEKVIPELFQDITWMQTDWAKNIEFTRTRHYYVSSFCKNYDDDTMKKKYGECVYGYKNDRLVELLAPIHLGHNEEEQTYPAFSQVIAFDVLYDKEMAKEEILFLCKIISLFKIDDSEKHDFLEEIMQYWILSVKDENWEEERERRYVIFMYDGYDYIDITYQESDFLKVKTTIFLLPDFILGNNPAKYQIRASLDNKRQATAMKDYDLCPVCLSADFDSVLDAPCICKICGNGEVNRIKIQGTAKRI